MTILACGAGADSLKGDAGATTMTGGAGADTNLTDGGTDTISDFTTGSDKINTTALTVTVDVPRPIIRLPPQVLRRAS